MKYFTASGIWYTADEQENRVAGSLRYTEDGIFLDLLGSFKGSWSPETPRYPLIYGVVGKNPYGNFVTLSDCFPRTRVLSFVGIGSETISCNYGVIGDAHLGTVHEPLYSLAVTLSHFDEWYPSSGVSVNFMPEKDGTWVINYRKPEVFTFEIEGRHLELGTKAELRSSARSAAVEESARLILKPLPDIGVVELQGNYVRPLQDFLSFATDTPNEIEDIEILGAELGDYAPGVRKKYHPIYNPISRIKDKKTSSRGMLFSFEEANALVPNIFAAWFSFARRNDAFSKVYFALLYAPPRFLEEKFLRTLLAFRLLAAGSGGKDARTDRFLSEIDSLARNHFPEGDVSLLRHALPTASEVELPFLVLRILEEYRPVTERLVGHDFPDFVRSLTNALSFVARHEGLIGDLPEGSDFLYLATQKVLILIKLLVLNELGFEKEAIYKFIERHAIYLHFCAVEKKRSTDSNKPLI